MPFEEMITRFVRSHPAEAARALEALGSEDVSAFFDDEPPEACAPVLTAMEPQAAAGVLSRVGDGAAAAIVGCLDLETASGLLRRIPPARRAKILGAADENLKDSLERVLHYPPNTAGSLMDPSALAVPADVRVREGLDLVLRHPERASYYLYVIDRTGALRGVINIRELMAGDPDAAVRDAMRPDPVRLSVMNHVIEILAHPGWLEYQVLPVVGENGRFEGALRHRTLRRLTREEPGLSEGGTPAAGGALGELFQIGLTGLASVTAAQPSGVQKEVP